LKKRSKKLLPIAARLAGSARKGTKVFWFFFSKKNIFPLSYFLSEHIRPNLTRIVVQARKFHQRSSRGDARYDQPESKAF
jgi:hypothetical protein